MRPAPRRLSSLLLGVALATTAFAGPVGAQDETSEPTESLAPAECSLLTVDEVSTALGEAFTLVDGDGSSCQFDGDYPSGRFISLFLSVAQGTTRQEIVSFLCSSTESPAPDASTEPCGADVPVGSSTGAYIPEGFGTMLYVDTGTGDLLNLQLVGDPVEGVVKLDALTSLGALALPRLASLPQPEETAEVPDQTFLPDADLEALFPTEIGGTQLTIESRRGSDAFQDSDIPQEILDALATQGKTLDDMSVASGYAFNADGTFVLITAIRVMGGDAAAFADTFVSVFNDGAAPAEQTQTQLSGKDVTVVRPTTDSTDDQLQYVYPKDDVVWVVSAAEPALSEAFSKLP